MKVLVTHLFINTWNFKPVLRNVVQALYSIMK